MGLLHPMESVGKAIFAPIVQPQRVRRSKINALLRHPAMVGWPIAYMPGAIAPDELVKTRKGSLIASMPDEGAVGVEGQHDGVARTIRGQT